MRHWLATAADQQRTRLAQALRRALLDGRFPAPDDGGGDDARAATVRVDLSFLRANDLAGLIWESVDRFDHPLTAYETNRDYRGCTLRFRWQSDGVLPLDAVNGPTLTIEGRDASGTFRGWYVRLWNYAVGSRRPTRSSRSTSTRWPAASSPAASRCSPATSTGCSSRSSPPATPGPTRRCRRRSTPR